MFSWKSSSQICQPYRQTHLIWKVMWIWPKFYQFDLYAGHKNYRPKCTITMSCTFKNLLLTKMKLLNFWILDNFCTIFFNSTYTRVDLYTSIYVNFISSIKIILIPHWTDTNIRWMLKLVSFWFIHTLKQCFNLFLIHGIL